MFKKDSDQEFVEEQLDNGQIKRYAKGRTLGKGGFAECYEFVSEETGKRYAAKVIDKETLGKGKAREKLQSQILIHKSLRHEHIVKFQHYFEDHDYVYILLQLCGNNTLNELLKRRKILTEVETKYYTWQLLQALKYLHSYKVIHRDLKLGNFFLNDSLQLKVGDFGLATTLTSNHERRKTVCGTPNYIAPEIIEGKKGHSYEVDIWSTGVIVFALLFGKPPFETNEVQSTYEKIKMCEYSFPKTSVSETAKKFIQKMLVLSPGERATIEDLMTDDFLTSGDVPRYLPLSSLACPPSKAFVEQIKMESLNSSKKMESEFQIQSSRTSKDRVKYKCTIGTDKYQSLRKCSKQGKTESSRGSMTRITSTATIATRKKFSIHNVEEVSPVLVTFFQEQPKYGMFYKTSAQQIGMRFNDQTCMISNEKLTKFRYVVMRNNSEVSSETFIQGREPEGLHKKIKIITHFAKLLGPKIEDGTPSNPLAKIKQDKSGSLVYLIAGYVTPNYSLFWLSNNFFQATFKDNSDILIDKDLNVHLFKNGKKSTSFKMGILEDQSEEIRQRVTHMWGSIKKVKRGRTVQDDPKKEKENESMVHSGSQARLVKKIESKPNISLKKYSSTSNIHGLKRPLSEYCSNHREERSQKHN